MENANGIDSTLNAEAINQPAQDFSYVEIPPQDSEANTSSTSASLLALDASFTSLKRLERKKYRTDARMARVEQKANKIITSLGNQVGFILSYSGAQILYQHLQLSCAVVGWITFVSVFCLMGGLGVVIWAARMELRRMIPAVQSLDSKRNTVAQEAQKIYNLESKRMANTNDRADDGPLHPTIKCKAVITRSQIIANSERYISRFERYNWSFISAAIICVVVNGAGICCIAYYTYCRVDVLGCKNPMMPPQPTQICNLPEESIDATLGDRVLESCPASMPLLSPTMAVSHVQMGLTNTSVVFPTILSPLGNACASMDFTAVHDILLKTGYKDEDGAENESGHNKFKIC